MKARLHSAASDSLCWSRSRSNLITSGVWNRETFLVLVIILVGGIESNGRARTYPFILTQVAGTLFSAYFSFETSTRYLGLLENGMIDGACGGD